MLYAWMSYIIISKWVLGCDAHLGILHQHGSGLCLSLWQATRPILATWLSCLPFISHLPLPLNSFSLPLSLPLSSFSPPPPTQLFLTASISPPFLFLPPPPPSSPSSPLTTGEGNYGEVYKAKSVHTGEMAAVKVSAGTWNKYY